MELYKSKYLDLVYKLCDSRYNINNAYSAYTEFRDQCPQEVREEAIKELYERAYNRDVKAMSAFFIIENIAQIKK